MSLPMIGEELAHYRLRAVLGRGGMSVVYLAEHPRLGSSVALKVLAPELATDDVFRARFLQESRLAASLNHPHVIPIYDMGTWEDLLYIAMRYVSGADLRNVLKARGRLSPSQALVLLGQTARALDAAHRLGLVHRDVKPGNILVERGHDEDDPDHVYLADFGISKHALSNSGLTATGQFMGTIDYIAPEQIRGIPTDGRADLYSLGCVLYECLTGRVPFVKDVDAAVIWAHVEEQPTAPHAIRPELPRQIDDVLLRALAKNPDDRYQTGRELMAAARAAMPNEDEQPPTVLTTRDGPSRTADAASDLDPPTRLGDSFGARSGPSRPKSPAPAERRQTSPPPPREPEGAAPRRRGGIVTVAVASLVIIAAVAVGLVLWHRHPTSTASTVGTDRTGAAPPTTARAGAVTPTTMRKAAANPIMSALSTENAEGDTKGLIPPSKCRALAATDVVCSNPSVAIDTATFKTYPSLPALYDAYVAEVKAINGGAFQPNRAGCTPGNPFGEETWNHSTSRRSTRFSIAQLEAPPKASSQSLDAGRLFCTIDANGLAHIVWTTNAGKVLSTTVGQPHDDVENWWYLIHHSLAVGTTMTMTMP